MTEQDVHTEVPAWIPVPPSRQLRVWTHILNETETFDDAVATMSPNGALTVWRWGSDAQRGSVPIKGYAPGSWLTFEHVGDGYTRPSFRDLSQQQTGEQAAAGHRRAAEFAEDTSAPQSPIEPKLADPFRELSPESLARQHDGLDTGNRQGEIHPVKPAQPDEDGDDAAFRQSGDDVPFDDPDPETAGSRDATGGGGVAQRVGRALVPIADQWRKWLGRLGLRFWDLRTPPPLAPLLPRWWASDPLLMAAVLITGPVVLYLSLAS